MPIVRIRDALIHFAHVPKCAGTAVEDYLAARFGPLAMLDRRWLRDPPRARWSRSSPQHMPVAALERLFPPGFLAASFAVVRNPHARLLSVFRFQRDIQRRIPPQTPFVAWLEALPQRRAEAPHYLDNHAAPMGDLVPEGAVAFRLEEGLAPLVAWLDARAGEVSGPRAIAVANTYAQKVGRKGREAGPEVCLCAQARALIAAQFAADFERFGYDPGADVQPPGGAAP